MEWIARAIGLFYLFSAFLLFRTARTEHFMNTALEQLTQEKEPDRLRPLVPLLLAGLYGAAGAALLVPSAYGLWLLIAAFIVAAIYYMGAYLIEGAEARADTARWRRAINAMMFSAIAIAASIALYRQGVLA
jgi:uncharacterized membrane protein